MKVIIMAAGLSLRLRPLTNDYPKFLLKVDEKTLAEYQLDVLTSVEEIKEIIIVIGYKGYMIREKIGDMYNGVKIKYINNYKYESTDVNYSLYLTRSHIINQPFIFLAGDTVFHPEIIKKLMDTKYKNCIIVDKNLKSKKVDSVITGKDNIVTNLHCIIHGDLTDEVSQMDDVVGEPIILVKFDNNYGEYLINKVSENGFAKDARHLMYIFIEGFKSLGMNYTEIENIPWVEVDNYEDIVTLKTVCKKIN